MKRLVALVLIFVLMICISGCSRIRISKNELAVLTYHDKENMEGVSKTLTVEESENLRQILKNAKYNAGIGGCAYYKEITLAFGDDRVFVFADDGCMSIMDIQNDKCYEVEDKEDWEYIVALFERYGGKL